MTIINVTGQDIAKPEAVSPTQLPSNLLATIADAGTRRLEMLCKILLGDFSSANHILFGDDSRGHLVILEFRVFNCGAQSNCTAKGENEKQRNVSVHCLIVWCKDSIVGCFAYCELWLKFARTLQAVDKVQRYRIWVFIDPAVAT